MNERMLHIESVISPEQQKAVREIYTLKPELAEIGTEEQYREYVRSIFPVSTVKDIVWHGSLANIEGGFKSNQHFGSREAAKSRNEFKKMAIGDMSRQEYCYPAVLNIKNIQRTNDADYEWEKEITTAKESGADGLVYVNNNEGKDTDSYLVFEPQQIHILGTGEDIQGFKEFLVK